MNSTPLIFNITQAGYQASIDQQNFGLQVKLSKLVFGIGHYESVDNDPRTTMVEPLEEANLTAGGLIEEKKQLILGLNFVPSQRVEVSEIGIYTSENVLFAIASKSSGEFFTLNPDLALVSSFALALGTTQNVTIVLQNDAPIFQQLMINHETAVNPHSQYALKVPNDSDHQVLFNQVNFLLSRVQFLENKVDEDIQVGDLFITTNHFANSLEVALHKKYGKWIRYAEGLSLVGLSTKTNHPLWTKSIGNIFGSYVHQITKAELPSITTFKQVKVQSWNWQYGSAKRPDEGFIPNWDNANSLVGNDAPHNNVQPSNVVGVWLRITDNYTLLASKNTANEGEQITFTLETIDVPPGTNIPWIITGIQSEDITPSSLTGNFTVGPDGKAYHTVTLVEDQLIEGTEVLKISLWDHPYIFRNVIINDTSTPTNLSILSDWGGTTITDEVLGETWYIKPSINVFDAFVAEHGRTPNTNERIYVYVGANVAVVGNDTSTPALIFDERLANNHLRLINYGYILGRGGNGASSDPLQPNNGGDGGTAVWGHSTVHLDVINHYNYSRISGGGGGGGRGADDAALDSRKTVGGGGGAPYGQGWTFDGLDGHANLLFGGGRMNSDLNNSNAMSGKGGDLGKSGENGVSLTTNPRTGFGGNQGFTIDAGSFNIIENNGILGGDW